MIEMQTAFTKEIDDAAAATANILAGIDLGKLKKNSVAIISCNWEYVDTGVLAAVSAAFPFDTVGCTAMGCGVDSGYGTELLSVAVLTSDDLKFSAALSDEITVENATSAAVSCYDSALAKLGGAASLGFMFAPMSSEISGDHYTKTIDAHSGGVPLFGTVSSETALTYENCRVFVNGESHRMKLGILLISGSVKPRFFTTSITDKNIMRTNAVVTESDGYILKQINGIPVNEYLSGIGIGVGDVAVAATLPLLLDYKDGTKPVAMVLYTNTEQGALCGGVIPVGCEIAFAEVDYESVMETAEACIDELLADVNKNGASAIFLIPCFTRMLNIAPNNDHEMRKTAELLGSAHPYTLIYSGGEICPAYTADGTALNHFHNLTYTAMVLD